MDGGPAASPPGGGILTASPPVNASQWANNQAETTIAIDPTNPQRLFTSAVSFSNANGLFAAYSTDGGVNWNRRIMAMGVATGNDSLPAAADDPQAAFDQFGNLFLVYRTLGQVQQGTSTAIGNNTLTDTNPGQPWATNMWQNHTITVMPPGADPQTRTIVSNTGTVITVNAAWGGGLPANCPYQITTPNGRSIVVVSSTDGGQTFDFRGNVGMNDDVDYPAITTGPSGNGDIPGAVWVVYRRTRTVPPNPAPGLYPVWAAVSGPGQFGPFTAPPLQPIANSQAGRGQEVAIGPNGQVMVTWDQAGAAGNPNQIFVSLDPDGPGPAPFANPRPMGAAVTTTNVLSGTSIPAQPNRRIWADPGLAWDRSGLLGNPNDGVIYLVYTDAPASSPNAGFTDTNIYYRQSFDSGVTWTAPTPVHSPNTNSQFMPAVSVDQTTGNAAFVWYDAREDAMNNVLTRLYGTVSVFGCGCGAPADLEIPIASGQSNATTTGFFDYGDYIGVAFYQNAFYPAWADNSNSTNDNPDGTGFRMDVYTARVVLGEPTGPAFSVSGLTRGRRGAAALPTDAALGGFAGAGGGALGAGEFDLFAAPPLISTAHTAPGSWPQLDPAVADQLFALAGDEPPRPPLTAGNRVALGHELDGLMTAGLDWVWDLGSSAGK